MPCGARWRADGGVATRRVLRAGAGDGGRGRFLAALRESAYAGWLVVEQDRFLTSADTPSVMLALQARNRAWLRAQG